MTSGSLAAEDRLGPSLDCVGDGRLALLDRLYVNNDPVTVLGSKPSATFIAGGRARARIIHEGRHEAYVLPIALAVMTALTVATASGQIKSPDVYSLDKAPASATLHTVTAASAEYKGRNALRVEFTDQANEGPPGVLIDMPTYVLIPTRSTARRNSR